MTRPTYKRPSRPSRPKYKPQVFDPNMSLGDLIQKYRGQAVQAGKALAFAESGTRLGNKVVYVQERMGRYFACTRLLNETEAELHRRLGVVTGSPESTNRAAFIWLAEQRRRGHCAKCKRLKTIAGQALNFWTLDSGRILPIPFMMAWSGASVARIEEEAARCDLLCRACAHARGARLLRSGNIDLSAYQQEDRIHE